MIEKHSNTHVVMSLFFFFFLGVKFCTNVKINMKSEHLIIFLGRKKSLDLQKIENHVATFSYWFWFGNNLKNV